MVAFLHDFYSTNHLHQLRELSIKPSTTGASLDLNFHHRGPGASRRRSQGRLERGARRSAAPAPRWPPIASRSSSATCSRNMSRRSRPGRKWPKTTTAKPPAFDPAKFAVLTAISKTAAEAQAWINVRTTRRAAQAERRETSSRSVSSRPRSRASTPAASSWKPTARRACSPWARIYARPRPPPANRPTTRPLKASDVRRVDGDESSLLRYNQGL